MNKPSFSINIMYWASEDPLREDNIRFAWHYLKKFAAYAKQQGLDLQENFFDFSDTDKPLTEDAIHLPNPKKEFHRAEKNNQIIDYIKASGKTPDFFSLVDGDMFIEEKDFYPLVEKLKRLKRNEIYVSQAIDIKNREAINFKNFTYKKAELKTEPRTRITLMDLGGIFFAPFWAIEQVKGFDTTIGPWGFEDCLISTKLQLLGLEKAFLEFRPLHLPHKSLQPSAEQQQAYQKTKQYLYEETKKLYTPPLLCELPLHTVFHTLITLKPTESIEKKRKHCYQNTNLFTEKHYRHLMTNALMKLYASDDELVQLTQHSTLSQIAPLLLMRLICRVPLFRQIADVFTTIHLNTEFNHMVMIAAHRESQANAWDTQMTATIFFQTLENYLITEPSHTPGFQKWAKLLPISTNIMPFIIKEYAACHNLTVVTPEAFTHCFSTRFFDLSKLNDAIKQFNGKHWHIYQQNQHQRLNLIT